MIRVAVFLCLAATPGLTAQSELKTILNNVESHYNHAKTLEVSFEEAYSGFGRPRQSEAGRLTLRKPGRMRWEYTQPAGKLFLSDGKLVYLYTPDLNRVERMPLKESEDMRAPLAFLLGKLDFQKEFRDFTLKQEGGNYLITAAAKSAKLPYTKIEMLVTPASEIRRLVVDGQDSSVLTYRFDQEKINPPLDDARFRFQMPPGATLVNGESGQ